MKFRALLVEDEPKAQQLLLHFLQHYCPQLEIVAVSENVATTISLLNNHSVDLVFLDIHLHGENGIEILEFIQINFPKIVTVITTANAEFRLLTSEFQKTHFLIKPLQIKDLVQLITTITSTINQTL